MVTAPDAKRWIVEARRPTLGHGVTLLVVRTLAGAVVWREVLEPERDPAARVAALAASIASDGWPGDDEARRAASAASSHRTPTLLVVLWLVLLTPLALLAWLRWASDDVSAAAPVVVTVAWVAAGALVALVASRTTSS